MPSIRRRRSYSVVLGALAAAFFCRVAGQLLVAFFHVRFLSPMQEWYSGLIPYPILLPIQILILLLQAKISSDLWRGSGYFAVSRPNAGIILYWFSIVYFLVMVARYIATMYLYPERRWFVGAIPIFFHWVLAAYVFVLARYHLATGHSISASPGDARN